MRNVLRLTVIFSALLYSQLSRSECTGDCVPVGQWTFSLGIGAGLHTNPLNKGKDIPLLLLPSGSYYGKRFFWQDDTIGFTLLDTNRHMLNLIATPAYDQMFFNEGSLGNISIEGVSVESSVFSNAQNDTLVVAQSSTFSSQRFILSTTHCIQLDNGDHFCPQNSLREASTHENINLDSQPTYDPINIEYVDSAQLNLNYKDTTRQTAIFTGLEYTYGRGPYTLALQTLKEVSGLHGGYQVSSALSTYLIKNTHIFG